jgi:hypothetical protein
MERYLGELLGKLTITNEPLMVQSVMFGLSLRNLCVLCVSAVLEWRI